MQDGLPAAQYLYTASWRGSLTQNYFLFSKALGSHLNRTADKSQSGVFAKEIELKAQNMGQQHLKAVHAS